jgi:hypothetical protein
MERRPVTTKYGARVKTEFGATDFGYVYWIGRQAAEEMIAAHPGLFELVSREVTETRLVVTT